MALTVTHSKVSAVPDGTDTSVVRPSDWNANHSITGVADITQIPDLTLEKLPDAWVKKSVRVATTANITLSGTQTIDGVAVVAGDRVLVKDQTTTSQNGIYVVAAGAWARSADADTVSELAGAHVNVDSGTANGGISFDTDLKTTDTFGTTAISFYRVVDTGLAGTTSPAMNGTAAVGTSISYARDDHVHPTDTSRAPNTHVGSTGTAHGVATTSVAGFMSSTDKTKLDGIATGATANTGTVTSVGLSLPAQFTVTGSPVTGSGTLTGAWASQTANYVFAAPNGAAGTPTFRALVAADIPTLNQNTTGTAANVTGTVAIANGGTGATTAAAALTNLGAAPASAGVPTGAIEMFAGATAPANWLLCNGAAVSRTTYSALFAVIGTTYGAGDGSTTFNLPNLSDRFPVGRGTTHATLGGTGGSTSYTPAGSVSVTGVSGTVSVSGTNASTTSTGTVGDTALTTAQLPAHNHGVTDPGHAHGVYDAGHVHAIREEYGAPGQVPYNPNNTYCQIAGDNAGTKEWHTAPVQVVGTGIGIYASATGISTNNAGSGATHTHSITMAGHTHTFTGSGSFAFTSATSSFAGTAATIEPPYIALNFIIKT